jgi:hypothetical protein
MPSRREKLIVLLLAALVGGYALYDPVGFFAILRQPLELLQRSQQELNATVIDVTRGRGPLHDASRRLLRPLGRIRNVRLLNVNQEED